MAEVQRSIAVHDIVGSCSDDAVTIRVPLTFRKRGGRKVFIAPDGVSAVMPVAARIDNALIKAIARAFRWRQLLESGVYATIDELAATEKINASYVSRVLRLSLLAPEIVQAILGGRQPAHLKLEDLMLRFPAEWQEQRARVSHLYHSR
jgi:hypothetical protein